MQKFYQILFHLLGVKPLLLLFLGVNVFNPENLPSNRQFIMIANHNSHLDALALMNLFPLTRLHQIHPVAAEDYFFSNPILAWFSKNFLNIIPIARSHISRHNNPLNKMCDALQAGQSLIIFPEGSRGVPEEIAPFQNGIAHLIQKFPEIPVVPVFLKGMGRSLPKGEFVLVPFFCDVVVGSPLLCTGTKSNIVMTLESAILQLQKQENE
jgi:1-acyl-sn-glycerol-3-phosphate acyltransferase